MYLEVGGGSERNFFSICIMGGGFDYEYWSEISILTKPP